MNTDIQLQKDLKKQFGATFTKNMSAKGILDTWINNVPASVKTLFPEINTTIMAIETAIALQQSLKDVTVTASTVYGTAIETLDDATSAIYTGGAVTVAKGALESASLAEMAQDTIVNQAGPALIGMLGQAIG